MQFTHVSIPDRAAINRILASAALLLTMTSGCGKDDAPSVPGKPTLPGSRAKFAAIGFQEVGVALLAFEVEFKALHAGFDHTPVHMFGVAGDGAFEAERN